MVLLEPVPAALEGEGRASPWTRRQLVTEPTEYQATTYSHTHTNRQLRVTSQSNVHVSKLLEGAGEALNSTTTFLHANQIFIESYIMKCNQYLLD